MKWSESQVAELKALCFQEVPNDKLAEHFGVPVSEIYAIRSHNNITIPKVKALLGIPKVKALLGIPKVKALLGEPTMTVNPELEAAVAEAKKAALEFAAAMQETGENPGLSRKVREGFKRLQDELLLAIASNWVSLDRAKVYGYLSVAIASTEEAFDRMMRGEA